MENSEPGPPSSQLASDAYPHVLVHEQREFSLMDVGVGTVVLISLTGACHG